VTHYGGEPHGTPGTDPADPSVMEYRESVVRGADRKWRYTLRAATSLFSKSGEHAQ